MFKFLQILKSQEFNKRSNYHSLPANCCCGCCCICCCCGCCSAWGIGWKLGWNPCWILGLKLWDGTLFVTNPLDVGPGRLLTWGACSECILCRLIWSHNCKICPLGSIKQWHLWRFDTISWEINSHHFRMAQKITKMIEISMGLENWSRKTIANVFWIEWNKWKTTQFHQEYRLYHTFC